MDTTERRRRIRGLIAQSAAPVTGAELAARMGVTRQVVVQDVALLRAGGAPILATPSGYVWIEQSPRAVRVFACRHLTLEEAREELSIMVREGGTVRDVIVEHPVYGELTGSLMLRTPEAVEALIQRLGQPGVSMLSATTGGTHLHTVEAQGEQVLDRIEGALHRAGLLIENERVSWG